MSDNALIHDAVIANGLRTGTPGGSQIERFDGNGGTNLTEMVSDRIAGLVSGNPYTMGWTLSASAQFVHEVTAWKAAPPGANTFFRHPF